MGNGSAQLFVIEHHQVFPAAATAGQHQRISLQRLGCVTQLLKHGANAVADVSLNGDGHHQQPLSGQRSRAVRSMSAKAELGTLAEYSDASWAVGSGRRLSGSITPSASSSVRTASFKPP